MKESKFGVHLISIIVFLIVLSTPASFQPCNVVVQAVAQETPSANPLVWNAMVEANFSIVWITDTQYLSKSYPAYFDNLCRWIVAHRNVYNVKMVVHTGDIVDSGDDLTQWANANSSMGILLDNGLPYCWGAGNDDFNSSFWVGDQFQAFNATLMRDKPYWLSDEFDGRNTAVHFNVSSWDFLIINIEYNANSTVLAWANRLLDAYPNSNAIVATHAYIDYKCRYSVWPIIFRYTVLENHPRVFLTLSGHFGSDSGNRTRVGSCDELMFDRQYIDEGMGAASLRILTFNAAKGIVEVKTYVLYTNHFLTDSNNQFTLETTFYNFNQKGNEGESILALLKVIIPTLSIILLASVLIYVNRLHRRRKHRNENAR